MPSITAQTKKITTLTVAVKCRPLTDRELGRDIVRVHNDKEVLVLDPDLSKDYLDRIQNRTKERRYTFDYAFGSNSTNLDVYKRGIRSTIAGVVQGLNATVFAYGSTGSGKTYTMVGTQDDPGLMVLSLNTIFDLIEKDNSSDDFEVTCSYLEVYNEVIYDLLEKSSGHLELREDPEKGIVVAGLRSIKVNSAEKILELLNLGNSRRKTESTDVNETSSRSHAVLEISVARKQQKKYPNQVIRGKLALVDLAGSERASETNSGGQKLRDGANINRSLLALANCINALGKQQKKGLAYVPYRNSKLTRILKDGLSGNSQTIMIATISPADNQYHHTVNTLKYADRAKEIKTHIQKNVGTIDAHVSDYQKMIDNLQSEVSRLRNELAEKETQLNAKSTEKAADDEMSLLNALSLETNENVQERINLQKALIELEETNVRNRKELQHLDDAIAKQQVTENDGPVVQALQARRQVILDNIRDNDEHGVSYQKEIEANEKRRCQLQDLIDEAIKNDGSKTYLGILSQYRLLGIANTELQFQMAIRDQIIYNQREVHRKLWDLLVSSGLGEKQIVELGAKQGITVDDIQMMTPGPSNTTHSPMLKHENYTPSYHSAFNGQPGVVSPAFFPQEREFGVGSFSMEHHASYYYISHGLSPSINQHWCNNQPSSYFGTVDQPPHGLGSSFSQRSSRVSHYDESFNTNFRQQQKQQQDAWLAANTPQVNMNSYVGMNRPWDPRKDVATTHHGERTPGVFGHFLEDQGATNNVNSRQRKTVAGFSRGGHVEEALQLFHDLLLSDVSVDAFTISSIFGALEISSKLDIGAQLHAYTIKMGFESEASVGSSLIMMYSKCGSIGECDKVFQQIIDPDLVCWTTMIASYANNGKGLEALQLFDQLKISGIEPDAVSFVGVLSACSHAGLVDEGYIHLHSMIKDYGIEPGQKHYACMVNILGRAGRLEEAKRFILSMPVKPTILVWETLLAACKVHGNHELGKLAAEKIMELQPSDIGAYISVSNIYAEAGEWDHVLKIREAMEETGVRRKEAGWSYV